jgi:hypothetical protein
VVVFALGSVTAKSAKSACSADGKTVETAIAAYEANVPGATAASVTQTVLTTGTNATLKSWPSNPQHYWIALNKVASSPADEVDVAAGNSATLPTTGWVSYDAETATTGCNAVS